jgi:hypothetical protein
MTSTILNPQGQILNPQNVIVVTTNTNLATIDATGFLKMHYVLKAKV